MMHFCYLMKERLSEASLDSFEISFAVSTAPWSVILSRLKVVKGESHALINVCLLPSENKTK